MAVRNLSDLMVALKTKYQTVETTASEKNQILTPLPSSWRQHRDRLNIQNLTGLLSEIEKKHRIMCSD
jgi:hypothetical protein